MKVKFLKNHLDNKADGVKEIEDGIGNYLVRVGVAEEVKEDNKEEDGSEKKVSKPKKKKSK